MKVVTVLQARGTWKLLSVTGLIGRHYIHREWKKGAVLFSSQLLHILVNLNENFSLYSCQL